MNSIKLTLSILLAFLIAPAMAVSPITGGGSGAVVVVPEASTLVVGDDTSTLTQTANTKYYGFFTLPTTEQFYRISAIEYKIATQAGNLYMGVDIVDSTNPTLATQPVAWGATVASTAGLTKNSRVSSLHVPGGTLLGVWIGGSSASNIYNASTVASANNTRSSNPANANINDTAAWVASTKQPYFKVYYVGIK